VSHANHPTPNTIGQLTICGACVDDLVDRHDKDWKKLYTEHQEATNEVTRLKDLLSRTVGPKALEEIRIDLSTARQSLYEVADQRDAFHKEVKRLRRFAQCHYMHMDGVCTKCGFPGHAQFDKEGT
jgi:divalent metal cation (Fe/Co/Zn/Cd) transporter